MGGIKLYKPSMSTGGSLLLSIPINDLPISSRGQSRSAVRGLGGDEQRQGFAAAPLEVVYSPRVICGCLPHIISLEYESLMKRQIFWGHNGNLLFLLDMINT